MTEQAPETGAEPQDAAADQKPTEMVADWEAEATKWKALARQNETQAKSNAEKATEYDRLVEANKSDQQRLEDRASTAEGRLTSVEAENARLRIALEKGVPADLVDRLRGETAEELAADADSLLSRLAPQQQPVPDLRPGAGQKSPGIQSSPDDWLRARARS